MGGAFGAVKEEVGTLVSRLNVDRQLSDNEERPKIDYLSKLSVAMQPHGVGGEHEIIKQTHGNPRHLTSSMSPSLDALRSVHVFESIPILPLTL